MSEYTWYRREASYTSSAIVLSRQGELHGGDGRGTPAIHSSENENPLATWTRRIRICPANSFRRAE
jgi:hypothetical protein